jgi:hypothetical protein
MGEIENMISSGKNLSNQASDRFNRQMESALFLVTEMDDVQMHAALARIKQQAGKQGMTIEELIDRLPEQAKPAIVHLQQRQEQVELNFENRSPGFST